MSELNFEEYNPSKVHEGGRPTPGKAHLLVLDTTEREGRMSVKFSVLAHEKDGNTNKTIFTNLDLSGPRAGRAQLFAEATGILTKERMAIAQAEGTTIDLDFEEAISKTICTEIKEWTTPEGEKKVMLGWTFIDPKSPAAEGYPRDGAYLEGDKGAPTEGAVAF